MKTTIFYSVCRYVPSILRDEKVNIGFAYHVPSDGIMGFRESKNIRRIKSFDDEIETDMINAFFESLKYDFTPENDIYDFQYHDDDDLFDPKLLFNKIMNYVNQIQFGEVSVYESEDEIEKMLIDIADMYLYYDKPINKRMTHDRVQSLAKKIVKSSNHVNNISNATAKTEFYDVPYDFKINFHDKAEYIKAISFDYVQPKRFFKEIKSYLYDLRHDLENKNIEIGDLKIVINNTEFDKEHEKIIQRHLPDGLEVLTLESFGKHMKNINRDIFH